MAPRESATQLAPLTRRSARKRRMSNDTQVTEESHDDRIPSSPSARKRQRKDAQPLHIPEVAVESNEAETESPDRHVYFGTLQTDEQDELASPELLSAKMPIKRRKTTSPTNSKLKRLRVVSRGSYPFTPDDGAETLRFTPLREIVDDRKRKKNSLVQQPEEARHWIEMAKKEERVRMLMSQIASGRHEKEIEAQMTAELEELRANILPELSEGLDNMLIVDNRDVADSKLVVQEETEEVDYDPVIHTSSNAWAEERIKLQDAILALSQQHNDAQERLRLQEMSLQALQLGPDNASAMEIIAAIQEQLHNLRDALSGIINAQSNADLLNAMGTTLLYYHDKKQVLDDRDKLVVELRTQINGLVECIADKENELARLRRQRTELLKYADDNDLTMVALEEERNIALNEYEQAKQDLAAVSRRMEESGSSNAHLQWTVTRYKESLQSYRADEERLQGLISRMEAEHVSTVHKMTQERESTVKELDDEIDAHLSARTAVELKLQEEQEEIARLEEQLDVVAKERDSVLEKLRKLGEELEAESTRREQAEATVQVRGSEADGLDAKVNDLEAQLADLQATMEDLRQKAGTERQRRSLSDEALRDKDVQLIDLQQRLDAAGIEQNKLRLKLSQVQENHNTKAARLEERLITECEKLTACEKDLLDCESHLQVSDRQLKDIFEDRDEYRKRVIQLEQAVEAAKSSKKSSDKVLAAEIAGLRRDIDERDGTIRTLKEEKLTLEERVHEEATEMLATQEELEELREALQYKQAKIAEVDAKARETDLRWQDLLSEREGELELLKEHVIEERRRATTYNRSLEERLGTIRDECAAIEMEGQRLSPITKGRARPHRRAYDSGIGLVSDSESVAAP